MNNQIEELYEIILSKKMVIYIHDDNELIVKKFLHNKTIDSVLLDINNLFLLDKKEL